MNAYTAGAGVRRWLYRKQWVPQQRLRAKVVSIGNITWGGAGKTPFTIWLASRLRSAGLRPSILTRGYGRDSADPIRFFVPGAYALDAHSEGDEVQLYLRHRVNVPIGISDSRFAAGKLIEERFPVNLHLLDDGFQHLGLARDLDLVLVDTSNPWGARPGFSRLLRESPRALRRAQALIWTRCELPPDRDGSRAEPGGMLSILTRDIPGIPQFRTAMRLDRFVEGQRESPCSLEQMRSRRVVAFCGLGNPGQFFATLRRAGIESQAQVKYPDHYRYQLEDLELLERLAKERGADCLLTTEKDWVNLPDLDGIEIPIYWAAIQMVVEEEENLLAWIGEKLGFPAGKLPPRAVSADRSNKQEVPAAS